jgi:hypothetical protein
MFAYTVIQVRFTHMMIDGDNVHLYDNNSECDDVYFNNDDD